MTETLNAPATSAVGPIRPSAPTARVFVRDPESEGIIRQSLQALSIDAEFTPGNVKTAITALAKEISPRLLVVDLTGVEDPVLSIRELAEVCEPDIRVVVIGDRNDIVLYRDLKNIGILEYFLKPILRDLLIRTCANVVTPNAVRPSLRTGKLIFVLGVRGGVGSTTIATNTAWYFAEARRRHTMLLDLDLQNGDAALQLDSVPSNALRDAFENPERVDKLYLERGVKHVTERLDLLASLESLETPLMPAEQPVLSLMERLVLRYRFVVVDLPAETALRMPSMLRQSSICMLVSNSSLAAARDVARWREFLGTDTPERSTLHILNHTTAHGGLAEIDFAKACGQAPDIVIPYDREIAETATYGIKAAQKSSVFKRGLAMMLCKVTGEPMEKSVSFFSRIFG
ncbi:MULTISPECIES: cellulose synthase operon protein YhjQ/BcsQ [Rhodomicrobium]|uniref:AAA family ATPase n=1 Tax=Rhodomicrobium TaxID=1068 RepID=UPI000B4AB9F9|nr:MULTISPECIES: cellulose synthase operon protein YhjQ/BcsQ [Rhodomicrobium]